MNVDILYYNAATSEMFHSTNTTKQQPLRTYKFSFIQIKDNLRNKWDNEERSPFLFFLERVNHGGVNWPVSPPVNFRSEQHGVQQNNQYDKHNSDDNLSNNLTPQWNDSFNG